MKRKLGLITILIVAIIFIIPNIVTHNMHIGADALFHYNRFYETAMQIKNGNFNYFISLYGFSQSGRIVNAVYGPVFAYLQGLIVLIGGTWYRYQVISNFLLYLISGFSMYGLFKYAKIQDRIAISFSIIFMGTYTIQYWVLNQGFTSWGSCVMPLCLIPAIDMLKESKFSVVKVSIAMAIMTQIHMLSTVMLGMVYFFAFCICWKNSKKRLNLLKKLTASIGLYALLTLNIWGSLIFVYLGNQLQEPFLNAQMSNQAITHQGSYWLLYPIIFVPLILLGVMIYFKRYGNVSQLTKGIFGISLIFLILSSHLVPWTWLLAHDVPFIRLIQFPFRFFVPFTVLWLFYLGIRLEEISFRVHLQKVLVFLALISGIQTLMVNTMYMKKWENQKFVSLHTFISNSPDETRAKFFSSDLSEVLEDYVKSTPDYLPIYQDTKQNKYKRYEEDILAHRHQFTKKSVDGMLEIEWESTRNGEIQLPIVLYKGSQLVQDGEILKDVKLSDIGTPTIREKTGTNRVFLLYKMPMMILWAYGVNVFAWGGLGLVMYLKRKK